MKVTKIGSATVIIETHNKKILCDPWLTDGVYYGSWCNYPPIDLNKIEFNDIDYIYISHVHPDHFDPNTMKFLKNSIPVFIHKYNTKFLKNNIEKIGFNVIELENGAPYSISDDLKITIFAADNCDPKICGHMFGCVTYDIKGSMQLDSLCVVEDGQFVLVNTNDCPFEIAEQALVEVKKTYKNIDIALIGYTSASLFPHCMIDYTEAEMEIGKQHAKNRGLQTALKTLSLLQPKYYMPFAGTYILGGKNFFKNFNLPIPEIQDAVYFLDLNLQNINIDAKPIILNNSEYFDLLLKYQSKNYIPIDTNDRNNYIINVASNFKYDYEHESYPSNEDLLDLFHKSMPRLMKKQIEISLFENINLVFDVNDGFFVSINLENPIPKLILEFRDYDNYLRFKLDCRLLKHVLQGPRFANWNNIEIGAHLGFSRKPDVFRPEIHMLLNSMHI